MLIRELTFAAIGTGFTCLATVLGAAMVFFFREDLKPATQKIFLGFAAGVMVAATLFPEPAKENPATYRMRGFLFSNP